MEGREGTFPANALAKAVDIDMFQATYITHYVHTPSVGFGKIMSEVKPRPLPDKGRQGRCVEPLARARSRRRGQGDARLTATASAQKPAPMV